MTRAVGARSITAGRGIKNPSPFSLRTGAEDLRGGEAGGKGESETELVAMVAWTNRKTATDYQDGAKSEVVLVSRANLLVLIMIMS